MSRYIDADEALRMMRNSKQDCPLKDDKKDIWYVAHDCAISCVEAVPTAEVVEVRHGEWKKSSPYNRFMNCSVCGFGQDHTTFKYCPNCGAKMDGERREQNEE